MVRIRERLVNEQVYYYLEHSQRKQGKVEKKELYLGKRIPRNIVSLKRDFLVDIYEDNWFSSFEKIKSNYQRSRKSMPRSARKKGRGDFMVRYTYNTQRIEGSTLTLRETAILLEDELTPSNRPLADVKEAEAHKKLFYEMFEHKNDLSLQTVLYWHRILLGSTREDIAGRIRQHRVAVSGSTFIPPLPLELDLLMSAFFRWYHKSKNTMHPVEFAAVVHLKFVTIHPFADGNGRLARILMNFILNRNGYPMMDIQYRNKNSYYNALERSQKNNDDSIFTRWIFRNFITENKIFL